MQEPIANCPDAANPDRDYLCPIGPTYLIPGLTDVNRWDETAHYRGILTGDLAGDAADELVARGVGGIQVFRFRRDLGQWSQVRVDPILPDRDGWDRPNRSETVRLGDVDGDGKAELVARGPNGMQVFRFVPGASLDAGSWQQLTASGPLSDASLDGADPAFWRTIQLVPLGRTGSAPAMQLAALTGSGLQLWRWNGSGWTPLATLGAMSGYPWTAPDVYPTIHAWDSTRLVARSAEGMRVWRYTAAAGPGSWGAASAPGPCGTSSFACNATTIQVAHGVSGVPADRPVTLARRAGSDAGLILAVYDDAANSWTIPEPTTRKPWSGDYDTRPDVLATIQVADIDGDGHDEVLGRASNGMNAFRLGITAAGAYTWGAALSAGIPALVDDPWRAPQYYETLATARLDSASPARSLLGRGPHGLRTWRFDGPTQTWARYRPYGSFPAVDSAALGGLTTFLGIAQGTIRDVYTDPTRTLTSDQLESYQNAIAARCSGLVSASPPVYQTCAPPAGSAVAPATWTAASNQIVAELYWAREVIDHFATLDDIQSAMFLDEDSTFPSLAADLRLAQAAGAVKPEGVDTAGIFSGVLEIMGTIAGQIPGGEPFAVVFDLTASALGIAVAATPKVSDTGPDDLDHTVADVQRTLATIRQQTQDAISDHRRYVLSDYGLLSTVGHLTSSQVWTLDKGAALSAGRERFTGWLYEQFLPVLWDQWHVANCGSDWGCPLPPRGPLLIWNSNPTFPDPTRVADFIGIVPKQLPCHQEFLKPAAVCHWSTFDEQGYGRTVQTLLGTVTPACTYDPRAGTAWRYGSCSLGVSAPLVLAASAPWAFNRVSCDFSVTHSIIDPLGVDCINPQVTTESIRSAPSLTSGDGRATGAGSRQGEIVLSLRHPIQGHIDLRGARITLHKLLYEAGTGAGELVSGSNGNAILPRSVQMRRGSKRHTASFASTSPNLRLRGTIKVRDRELIMSLRVRGELRAPQGCGSDGISHLGHQLVVVDHNGRRLQILSSLPWHCVTKSSQRVDLYYPQPPRSRMRR